MIRRKRPIYPTPDGKPPHKAGHGSAGDWVIDAWEVLLGTDPQDPDSDDDHCRDGDEILGYGHPYLSELSDPLDGECHLELRIFANGFETGDLSAWDGSVP